MDTSTPNPNQDNTQPNTPDATTPSVPETNPPSTPQPPPATQNPNTPRTYEKIALQVFCAITALMWLSFFIPAPGRDFALIQAKVFDLGFLSMPVLFLAAAGNIFRLIWDHARFFSKRYAITLGIMAATALNMLIVLLVFFAGIAAWASGH